MYRIQLELFIFNTCITVFSLRTDNPIMARELYYAFCHIADFSGLDVFLMDDWLIPARHYDPWEKKETKRKWEQIF